MKSQFSVVAAAGSLAIGLWLAWHHPLAPALTASLLVLWSIAVFLRPTVWVFLVPALLPIIDLAPWTGWLIFEEFDILLLGAAAGAYFSMAWRGRMRNAAAVVSPSPRVAAESHDAAAKTFVGHPHLQIPQSSIEVMEINPLSGM